MKKKFTYQNNSFSILTAFLCFAIIGINCLPYLNLRLNPSRTLPNLQVSYYWPEASAKVIESEVTSKLEGLLNTMQGVRSISSVTSRGHGNIHIAFKENINIDAARFEIANLLRQSYPELPEQVSYPVLSLNASGEREKPVLTYTLNAASSPYFIQKYAAENIVPALSVIEGVGQIRIYGAAPYQWEITYNTESISILGISPDEIAGSINTFLQSRALGAASLVSPEGEKALNVIITQNPAGDYSLEEIPIKSIGNRIIYLKDIATARFTEQDVNAYFRVNGLNTVNLVMYPEKGVNHLQLAKTLRAKTDRLMKELPAGYTMLLVHDESEFISKELKTISLRFLFSFLILLVFVLLVSRQLRYLLLIMLSILANLVIAVAFYYLLGLEIHLYSLAGITISLGIVIDNSIVMIDHLRHKGDRKVLPGIVAATMTTVGALGIIFLLKEEQRVNLIDFAFVIATNLGVSILIAMYFIPALMEKIFLRKKQGKVYIRRKRRIAKTTVVYHKYIRFSKRYKWAFVIIAVLGFGIPVHWLPDKVEKDSFWSDVYQQTLGSDWFREYPKPYLEKIMGGGLRLFTEFVFENSFYSEPGRTTLHVRGTMPEGCTIEQLNEAIIKMETFISRFDEVERFETSITSYRNSDIAIYFKEEHEWGSFPYYLKSELESKAISLGGLDWAVYGVGRGFSNALHSWFRNSRIQLEGYNYDQLYNFAESLRNELLQNPRIKEVDITGPDFWGLPPLHEYFLDFDAGRLAIYGITKYQIYNPVKSRATQTPLVRWFRNGNYDEVVLKPDVYEQYDVWNLRHSLLGTNGRRYKLSGLGTLEKRKSGNDIHKRNQQYQLCVAYDFIGPDALSRRVREEKINAMNERLPLGFSASEQQWSGWRKDESGQYYLILLVIAVIFVICAVLFESLRQPLAIVTLIPISFIGIFLTFYLFDINFDQGGFASFIMVSGLVVNAGIYVINDYNNFRKLKNHLPNLRTYLKAFNYKFIPILLTLLSTILGLIPFLWKGQHEVFWYAFAAGTIGGLVFSLVALVFYLPLFLGSDLNRSESTVGSFIPRRRRLSNGNF